MIRLEQAPEKRPYVRTASERAVIVHDQTVVRSGHDYWFAMNLCGLVATVASLNALELSGAGNRLRKGSFDDRRQIPSLYAIYTRHMPML